MGNSDGTWHNARSRTLISVLRVAYEHFLALFSILDERKKRSINEMFGDEDSDDSGDEKIARRAYYSILYTI